LLSLLHVLDCEVDLVVRAPDAAEKYRDIDFSRAKRGPVVKWRKRVTVAGADA
jgi:hypothetical protein